MDDTCAVCADTLEWSAYGACGHKDVCSTCVARLRFICDDRRCCICKTESHVVFVTKALGDYTKTISDFSLLPSEPKEGRVGSYWYHEDTQALFDDLEHYKMIKAMCKLSCSVCDKMEDQPGDTSKRIRFRSIDQLKGHLFHKHKLFMCNLCLEGRKVFICEQKLFTRPQLTRHMNTGDSEADGPESERDGFTGHPMCEFCRNPFYGDNELYLHMSTEHYTCHICQRRHPGQYEYYKNYDELEMHFRHDHFLCEDEGCLGKKFIVFPSEAELKRHNTLEHGGRMSRSQRSAALQLPTSFRYRRSNEHQNRRERGRVFERDPSDSELALAIQASLHTDSPAPSNSQSNNDHVETADVEANFPPLESSAASVPAKPFRYLRAASHGSINGGFGESSFPPLSVASGSNRPNSLQAGSHGSLNGGSGESSFPTLGAASGSNRPDSKAILLSKKNMADHLRSKNNGKPKVLVSSNRPMLSHALQEVPAGREAWPSINAVSGQSTGVEVRPAFEGLSSQSRLPYSSVSTASSSSRNSGVTKGIVHSSSAPNLSGPEFTESMSTDFPPVSSARDRKASVIHPTLARVEDVHSANKSLVEKMRASLGHDDEKFTMFRDISGDYRQGLMDAKTYVAYVDQFGLSHLVHELARLLPDVEKQKELIEAYDSSLRSNEPRENLVESSFKDSRVSKKGKGKAVDSSSSTTNIMSMVSELHSRYVDPEEEVEVLSRDGYRPANGKSKIAAGNLQIGLNPSSTSTNPKEHSQALSLNSGASHTPSNGEVKGKQKKKGSKFLRARLGDGAVEQVLDHTKTDLDDGGPKEASVEGSSTRGVWKNGGGQKLVAAVTKPRH